MKEPIRILHVVVNMNRGGAETFIMNLYRNIDRSKVQFDFLTSKEGVFDKEILEMGGKVHRIPSIADAGHFRYNDELLKFFNRNTQYKIVHSHMDKMSGFILRAAKKANIPIRIAHSHSTQSEGRFIFKVYKWYSSQFIKSNATSYMACSQVAGDWLFGNNSTKAYIVNNGIEPSNFRFSSMTRSSVRRKIGIDDKILVVGHIGRFYQPKNHSFLIDIFNQIYKKEKNSILLLVGIGELQGEIRQKVESLGLSDVVHFLDLRSDISDLLQAMDIFLFPSVYEGLPVTLIEAQASGIKCIISDTITEAVKVTDGVDFISLNQSANYWADQVLKYKKSYVRKDTYDEICESGYDIKVSAKWLQCFYLKESQINDNDFFVGRASDVCTGS